ncbi:beta subunit of N-acylethanolamine-hydrolyzing acid amidase-domain-containing protein [Xylariaceae sp. FL1272]|nr:beta subunit of N-acylethanolamine-hydrolyzing acid amidase-domain-containing protein [Xylariaceae sp. FL1272]
MSTPQLCLEPIPSFTIDLARPPRERYNEVVQSMGARMRSLTVLYDDLLQVFIGAAWLRSLIRTASKHILRRVYDEEENEEIKGISAGSGVPLYLLVALNNLLDCLLGCTSGAVPVAPPQGSRRNSAASDAQLTRLMHFRTLDWGMDELRDILVVLEFVDSSSANPGQVIARSITYAGFVGSLTAVRKDLSISLNHRPCHDCSGRRLRWHQLMVLLGKRRSIGSIMRRYILQPVVRFYSDEELSIKGKSKLQMDETSDLTKQAKALTRIPTAPCYLTLCDGDEAAVIVKDYMTGTVRTSKEFIAQTNHDPGDEAESDEPSTTDRQAVIQSSFGVEGWVRESIERLECIQKRWDRHVGRKPQRRNGPRSTETDSGDRNQASSSTSTLPRSISEATLRRWLSHYPTLNECSHYTCILDPKMGVIRALKRGTILEDYSVE